MRGDAAVKDYTNRFDRYNAQSLHLTETFIAEHAAKCPADVLAALEFAAERIVAFHQKQLPQDISYTDTVGGETGIKLDSTVASGNLCTRGTGELSKFFIDECLTSQNCWC